MNNQPLISAFADDAEMAGILREFVEGMQATKDRLRMSLQDGNMVEVERIGHQMKGAGASYGFEAITRAGAQVEAAVSRSGDVHQAVEELCKLMDRAYAGMDCSANAC